MATEADVSADPNYTAGITRLCSQARCNRAARADRSKCETCLGRARRYMAHKQSDPAWSARVPGEVIYAWLQRHGITLEEVVRLTGVHLRRDRSLLFYRADRIAVAFGVHVSIWDPYYARVAELEAAG